MSDINTGVYWPPTGSYLGRTPGADHVGIPVHELLAALDAVKVLTEKVDLIDLRVQQLGAYTNDLDGEVRRVKQSLRNLSEAL